MNHKRRRPKHQRAGCLWCKPHKDEREADPEHAARRQAVAAGLNDRDEMAWADDSDPASRCVAGPHCEECGEPFAEHVEMEGPLRVALLDLARLA